MSVGIGIKAADTIAEWEASRYGITRNLPPHRMPKEGLWNCNNTLFRDGGLRVRPGFAAFDAADLGGRVTGAYELTTLASAAFQSDTFQNDSFQVTPIFPGSNLFAGTTAKIWAYFSGKWNDITDVALTASPTQMARFTQIAFGSPTVLYMVHCNGVDVLRTWDQLAATVSQAAGAPPTFFDITTASNRIVGLVSPYTVQWGGNLSLSSWPAANTYGLMDTPDAPIAIRNLGALHFIVYKKRSIWAGIAQGGLDSAYFRFEFRGWYEGPASAAAVVEADGVHYYLTSTGRIGMFDGSQHQWINEGALPVLRTLIDASNMNLAFGTYNPIRREVNFYYPKSGDNGAVKGIITIFLPRPFGYEGFTLPAVFLGTMGWEVSAGVDRRLTANDVILFRSDGTKKSYKATDDTDDAGTAIAGSWQVGFQDIKGRDSYRVEALETLAERGVGYGSLSAQIATQDVLDVSGGTLATAVTVDLTKTPKHPDMVPATARGRLLSVYYSFTTPITLRWYGARLAGRMVE